MSSALVALVLAAATAVSLGASAVLVVRLERICAWLGLSAALLGLSAALAADAPEITSAVTALARGQQQVGTGVMLGSNVFNLAALIGLGAVTAGGIALHRRSVLLEGGVALWMAAVTLAAVTRAIVPALAMVLALAVLVPYVYISAAHPSARARVPAPARLRSWLAGAINEEDQEISGLIPDRPGDRRDLGTAALALAGRGVTRRTGLLIIYAYAVFTSTVVITATRAR